MEGGKKRKREQKKESVCLCERAKVLHRVYKADILVFVVRAGEGGRERERKRTRARERQREREVMRGREKVCRCVCV